MPTEPLLPLRGEVWDVRLAAPVGDHPAVVLGSNALRRRLSAVTVVVVTGSEGPPETHISLDRDAGVTKYDESYANATDLHTLPLARFRRRRGLLTPSELERLEDAVRLVLEL